MKLINEKGRLFGLINVVDLLVLLALLVGFGAVAMSFAAPAKDTSQGKEKLVYTVRVRGILEVARPMIEDALAQSLPLYMSEQPLDDAYLVHVKFEEYYQVNATSSGGLKEVLVEDRWDAVFTMEALVRNDDTPIQVGNQHIRVGINHTVRTAAFEYLGSIESLVLEEEGT